MTIFVDLYLDQEGYQFSQEIHLLGINPRKLDAKPRKQELHSLKETYFCQ